ncbi:MAG TPA: hypothetical protein ACYCC7_01100 [Candidatus Azoamicus sp. MARI]
MGIGELTLIIILCILLLKPNEIKILLKNISNLIFNINKYTNSTKEQIIKLIDIEKKNDHK